MVYVDVIIYAIIFEFFCSLVPLNPIYLYTPDIENLIVVHHADAELKRRPH